MNKKRIWFVIPTALLPYFVLCGLAVIFFSTKHPLFKVIMERIFSSNALYIVAVLLILSMLAAALSIISFFISIRKDWNALSLAKTAIIIKIFQIPAYAFIFIFGVILATTIFTIPFAFGLFLFDCLTLILTGLLTIAAVINAVRQRIFTWKETSWVAVLQLIFCADVVSSIIFFLMLKKERQDRQT